MPRSLTSWPRSPLVGLLLLDLILTLPFIYHGPAEGDTLRYALDLEHWRRGTEPLHQLFNANEVAGFYLLARPLAALFQISLDEMPTFLNRLSWICGLLSTAALFCLAERWFDRRISVRWTLLVICAPAWWALHLYGNPNMVGLAPALAALAVLPHRDTGDGPAARRALALRTAGAGMLAAAALWIRVDLVMLAPAVAALALLAPRRPALPPCLGAAILALAARWGAGPLAGLDAPLVANVGRHVTANLSPGNLRVLLENLSFFVTGFPPLVAASSLVAAILLLRAAAPERRMVALSLLWAAPLVLFAPFARMPLPRILIGLVPAVLLPLAAWSAGRGYRSGWDARLVALVLASHLLAAATPGLLRRAAPTLVDGERRAGHAYFLGSMFTERWRVATLARETLTDAEEVARLRSATVIGEDIVWYEYALATAWPGVTVLRRETGYRSDWYQARSEDGSRWWNLVTVRPNSDPARTLHDWKIETGDTLRFTPLERRVRGMP
ncbi:MAG: hypothetical protein IT349_11220 [Candidatus Eisenbacteria bacterium]|nr:hypothetical protein [Candidatus Eisenbacteria bacterium]